MKRGLILVLLIMSISLVSAYGSLDTGQIGKSVNLNNTNQVELTIKTHNPSQDTISVNLEGKEFKNLLNDEVIGVEINIENPSYTLIPDEKGESKVTITNLREGHLEGHIAVTFSKEGIEQKTTLNSVIKLNVTDGKFTIRIRDVVIAIGFVMVFLFIAYLFTKRDKKQPKESEPYYNRKDYKPLEPYTYTQSER